MFSLVWKYAISCLVACFHLVWKYVISCLEVCHLLCGSMLYVFWKYVFLLHGSILYLILEYVISCLRVCYFLCGSMLYLVWSCLEVFYRLSGSVLSNLGTVIRSSCDLCSLAYTTILMHSQYIQVMQDNIFIKLYFAVTYLYLFMIYLELWRSTASLYATSQ